MTGEQIVNWLIAPVIAVTAWAGKRVQEHETRLTVLERMTDERHAEVTKKLDDINDTLKGVVNYVVRNEPPTRRPLV